MIPTIRYACFLTDESKSWKARLSGLFPSFTSKPKTHKANPSAASESSSGTKKSEYSRRVQELRELVRQQKLEVKPLWNRDEDDLDFQVWTTRSGSAAWNELLLTDQQEAIWCSEDYEYEESHESVRVVISCLFEGFGVLFF